MALLSAFGLKPIMATLHGRQRDLRFFGSCGYVRGVYPMHDADVGLAS